MEGLFQEARASEGRPELIPEDQIREVLSWTEDQIRENRIREILSWIGPDWYAYPGPIQPAQSSPSPQSILHAAESLGLARTPGWSGAYPVPLFEPDRLEDAVRAVADYMTVSEVHGS